MEKDFDFIKRQENYKMPDNFFDSITERTLAKAKSRQRASIFKKAAVSGVAAAVAIVCGVLFTQPALPSEITIDSIVAQIAEDDMQELLMAMDTDVFYTDYEDEDQQLYN